MNADLRLTTRLALVLLSAVLLPLCFPPFGWWPLVLLVFPCLFLATTGTTARCAYYLGLVHGIIGYGLTLRWFFNIFSEAAFLLFAIMGVFTGIFCLCANFFAKRIKSPCLIALLVAVLWTGIEFYRSELFFLRFPWITAGSSLGPTVLSPVLGVYGMSFLVVMVSVGLSCRKIIPWVVLLSLFVLGLGLFRPGRVELDEKASVAVTVVQSEDCVLQSYVALTKTARDESSDLIIWPECSLPYDVRKDSDDFSVLTNLCAKMSAVLVVGTRTDVGSGPTDWHNTALILDRHGVLGEYYKARPVHFFNDGIPGHEFRPVQTDLGAFSTPICFDCDYSEVTREMVMLGAEFFAVPSFDAKSWGSAQHVQHALLFRLRAAETARWIACAASSGVSQIIDPHGNVHASLPPMETGVLTYRVGRRQGGTFFIRAGWLFPWLSLGCSAVLIIYMSITFTIRCIRNVLSMNEPR
ncbi:nitrilase-related carbon-nitrogen hydrolase [Pontiellaceae bacterium B1224]|nr:nitrilase-related carbon-nitrogen hydrolase [Pontiellaceae bacterium B1224]